MSLDEEARSEVTVDVAATLHGPQIVCRWHHSIDSLVVWAKDVGPSGSGRWHTVRLKFGHLICNCMAWANWKRTPESRYQTCKHVVGVADWLEVQNLCRNLDAQQIAFVRDSASDMHRIVARDARRQEEVRGLEALREKPLQLEDLFDI